MPEILLTQYSTLIFFLLTLSVMVVMFAHHHLSSKKGNGVIHNPLQVDPKTELMPIEDLEGYYRDALAKTYDHYKQSFDLNTQKAEAEFTQYLAELQVRAQQTDGLIESVKRERIDTLFDTLEQRLATVIDETVKKTLATIEKDLEDSHAAVQSYTNKQLSLIDQNAIDLLEKTLSIVLIKKMSLRDQLDLVYEALEKAKLEKFLSGSQAAAVPTETQNEAQQVQSVPEVKAPEAIPANTQPVSQSPTPPPIPMDAVQTDSNVTKQ